MSSPLDFLKEFFEGNIDFVGQHYAEEAARSILIAGTVLSFFAGYFSQSMKVTFSALGSFVILAAVNWHWWLATFGHATVNSGGRVSGSTSSSQITCSIRNPASMFMPKSMSNLTATGPPKMKHWLFVNTQRVEWLTQPFPEPQPLRSSLTDSSLETLLNIFGHCSPADLVAVRGVCKLFKKILDDKPYTWNLARKGVCNMPPPPEGKTEWAWANRICTGLLDSKIDAKELWSEYKPAYKAHKRALNDRLQELLQALEPLDRVGAERCRLFEHLRSPRFRHMFNSFLRDLKLVDSRTLSYELPFIRRELGQIATCDYRQVPDGFHFEMYDRIMCPLCHPNPAATREHLLAYGSLRLRFLEITVQADDLQDHYREFHAKAPVPHLGIFTRCSHCDALPPKPNAPFLRQTVFTAKRLRDHDKAVHVVVNPGRHMVWHATLSEADAAGP
ncbi:uncharacterized protein SCHCODRAFT_01154521 [Schizophyllum commune H4-8]|uniref:F-box domain-containing protein n=1 Tax=Schizophyllum commune (strain H4-8 / FGSC 9210) TaxID=578458 RepID=D8Q7F8_SCHCM|nr:uncharacterized protein SCHCODRAFT_01154521 [Schizophyllum commune H4-8]KAI5891511.1 hypothetical protein SCHCODRAFT_01154521 [Schizophyllum commune H4-8]